MFRQSVRTLAMTLLGFLRLGIAQFDSCTNGTIADIGNGRCDAANNNPSCGFDGGDCCSCTCGVETLLVSCSDHDDSDCVYPECPEQSLITSNNETCQQDWSGDGFCDDLNNNPSCGYDGGDCCECSCLDSPSYACGSNGFECLDPACFNSTLIADYPDCLGNWASIGDGTCDGANNNAECGYDGGDCCLCTCSGASCSRSAFDCIDPDALDEFYDCRAPPPAVFPCSSDVRQTLVVETSAQAKAVVEAVNCSGGSFEVEWIGRVVLDETIYVANGTILTVVGDGSSSVIDGNDGVRPFTVDNAILQLRDVDISNGASVAGGAVAAVGSTMTFNRTNFIRNNASRQGGAVYVSGGSIVTCTGTTLDENQAGIDGGAMYVTDSSEVFCDGLWTNNTAGDTGGALMVVSSSVVSWSEESTFAFNSAGRFGGAVYVHKGSQLSWDAATLFSSNSAWLSGGALVVNGGSNASWSGVTSFANNHASEYGFGGALSVINGSVVSWSESTTFVENTAGNTGGAVLVDLDSMLSWNEEIVTSFERNEAGNYGGALYVTSTSSVWCTPESATFFSENSALHTGGAVSVVSNSDVSFDGNLTFDANSAIGDSEILSGWGGAVEVESATVSISGLATFTNNMASDGGALYAGNASIAWIGEMVLKNNKASRNGGALYFHESTTLWVGSTEIVNNSADTSGGGLFCLSSDVSSNGNTTFANNNLVSLTTSGGAVTATTACSVSWNGHTSFVGHSSGFRGGAIDVRSSNVSWSGNTYFARNTAEDGGAIFVEDGSHVHWSGTTEFSSNVASADGGAVGSTSFDPEFNSQESTIAIGGATSFVNNTAGQNGGGMILRGGVSLSIGLADVSFVGNSADISGGAIYLSDTDIGPTFDGVSFVSNSAEIGGAVAILSCGNSPGDLVSSSFPTTFNQCHFLYNRAGTTGGAIDSAAGKDVFGNSIFEENESKTGGALRIAGTSRFHQCSFVDNVSEEGGGAAVSNIGLISTMESISFIGNGFNCEPGSFLEYEAETREGDLFEAICDGCETACEKCSFDDPPLVPKCTTVMDHATSNGGNTSLETLSIERGYWRATTTSEEILECYRADACLGGLTGRDGYCDEGYEGPYCSVCSDGYTRGLGYVCSECSDKAGGVLLAIFLAVIAFCAAVAVVLYMVSGEGGGRTKAMVRRIARFIPLQSLKILVVSWQILIQFASVANVTYPGVYQEFLDGLEVFNFDLSWVLSAGCIIDVDFHGRLLVSTISPIMALLFLGGTYTAGAYISRGKPGSVQIIWEKHVSMVLLVTFLVYSGVSSTLFQAFACEELDDGKNYLRADYRIECDSSEHKAFQVYAGFMIVVFTAGIPALYSILLFRDRGVLKNAEAGREDTARITAISDLWQPYKPSAFYYELIECARRVLLTGVVVFIYPNTTAQVAITLMMAAVFAMLSESLAPYVTKWDTWISRMGHVVVTVSMYVALLLKVDVSDEQANSQRVFEAVLVTAHGCMILSVFLEAFVVTYSLWSQQIVAHREQPAPRFRPGKVINRLKDGGDLSDENPFSPHVVRAGSAPNS